MSKDQVTVEFIDVTQKHHLGTGVIYEHLDRVIRVPGIQTAICDIDGKHMGVLCKVEVRNGVIHFEGRVQDTPENRRDIGLAQKIETATKVKPPRGVILERIVLGSGLYYDMAGRWAGLAEAKASVCKRFVGYKRLLREYRSNRIRLVAEVLSNG